MLIMTHSLTDYYNKDLRESARVGRRQSGSFAQSVYHLQEE